MLRPLAVLSVTVLSLQPVAAADYATLPKGQGRDVMVRVCAQCHSPELAAQQNLDQAGWKALVDQMANNGAQASDAEFNTITKYLAASFPPSRIGQPMQAQGEMRATQTASKKETAVGGHARTHAKVHAMRRAVSKAPSR